jgi:hypothetical protein
MAAAQWYGCMYDTPGGEIDIGQSILSAAEALTISPLHTTRATNPMKNTKITNLSDFIRNASPEHKAEVYGKVMDKAAEQQQAVIDGVALPPGVEVTDAGVPVRWNGEGRAVRADDVRVDRDLPPALVGERVALCKLREDVESLPLHPHKRKVVRDWISAAIESVEQELRDSTAGVRVDAPSAEVDKLARLIESIPTLREQDQPQAARWAVDHLRQITAGVKGDSNG